jgi:ATP-dependent RNA helicase DHX29
MAPNKKKKKAASNARGFATTSTPSKPKLDQLTDAQVESSPRHDTPTSEPISEASERQSHPIAKVSLTPEEYEAQLERDALQLLVEKHASKVRREARRQVGRIRTDRRVLRGQAQALMVHEWVPDAVLEEIMSLAQAELDRKQGQQSLLKTLSEEDALSKLWILSIVLSELGFVDENIVAVLKWLCANIANVDGTSDFWGFQECLEWLALNRPEENSLSYEEAKPKRLEETSVSLEDSRYILSSSILLASFLLLSTVSSH